MKIRKLLAAALVAIMLLAAVPVASMAEAIGPAVYEAKQMSKLDKVWAALDAVEAKALAANMNVYEIINHTSFIVTKEAVEKIEEVYK